MGDTPPHPHTADDFLRNYSSEDVRIAAEFLSNWLPFLSRSLCESCTHNLSHAIESLHTGDLDLDKYTDGHNYCHVHSAGSVKDSVENDLEADTHSVGSWKDGANCLSPEHAAAEPSISAEFATPLSQHATANSTAKKSWADMALEDELEVEGYEVSNRSTNGNASSVERTPEVEEVKPKLSLSREERESIRFSQVERKKDFICIERVNGKLVNILEGLELHKGVFSAAEQKRIVKLVEELAEKGRKGKLKARTYSKPVTWMRGKGRVTLQFGCCYNYAVDKNQNPPGILKDETVDPFPGLFKVMIKRLIRWHVLPPSCVPDSCIVNIYEEGNCIPPHIDSHDFLRPFCTVSFLSECNILFSSNLRSTAPGEFAGSFAMPLPVGSVLVLKGNGADVAKHCVPAVPTRRISITFRRMDVPKRPFDYAPDPDLQGLEPWLDAPEGSNKLDVGNRSINSGDEGDRLTTSADEGDRWKPYKNDSRPRAKPRHDFRKLGGGGGREGWMDNSQGRGWVGENADDRRYYGQGHANRRRSGS